jgi:hypothetical protein
MFTNINVDESNQGEYYIGKYYDIMIFLEDTIIQRYLDRHIYTPIGNCIEKLNIWHGQSYRIKYITPRKNTEDINVIKSFLEENKFPGYHLYYRGHGEGIDTIVYTLLPRIFIANKSWSNTLKKKINIYNLFGIEKIITKQIFININEGIDTLPDNISDLLNYEGEFEN